MPNDVILEGRDLRKVFGALVAVDGVNIQIERGHVHSIIGPNGAGKTTLMNLFSGLFKPTNGTIRFKNQDITDRAIHARAHLGIGRSFQITNIFPNLTVLENARLAAQALSKVNFQLYRRAATYQKFVAQAMDAIEIVGLSAQRDKPAQMLPHGGKRKLELAILLAGNPDVLLLDEPTAGVASEQIAEIIEIIRQVRKNGNKTIVIVEHNMSLVMNVSDRITVMHLGKTLAEGTPAEIAANKGVQSAYLGELYADVMPGVGAHHD